MLRSTQVITKRRGSLPALYSTIQNVTRERMPQQPFEPEDYFEDPKYAEFVPDYETRYGFSYPNALDK